MIDRLAKTVQGLLPRELGEDIRRNVDAAVRSSFEKMGLVTREELEVQEVLLTRTREQLLQLEQQVKLLEQQLLDKTDVGVE